MQRFLDDLSSRIESMSDIVRKDNYDLQAEWDRVFRSYLKTTGADLTKSSNLSPDEVVGLIKAKEEKDEADGAKFRVAKDVIGKLLTTIETLGSIAAQGAGMVLFSLSLYIREGGC